MPDRGMAPGAFAPISEGGPGVRGQRPREGRDRWLSVSFGNQRAHDVASHLPGPGLADADGFVIAMAKGKRPTLTRVSAVLVAVRIGVTVPPSLTT